MTMNAGAGAIVENFNEIPGVSKMKCGRGRDYMYVYTACIASGGRTKKYM